MKILCNACPRRCNAERTENTGSGYCGMPLFPVIALADLHFGEEPCISGEKGSGTVFFSGCSLNCVFCQNEIISHKKQGIMVTPERLAEIFKELEEKGSNNINLVNPTHFIWAIKEALKIYRPKIPLVYNSGGYDDQNVIKENVFDVYLMDLKYVSSEKSLKYSGAADYFEVASKSIKAALEVAGTPVLNGEGIMQSGVIIRHLVLPLATKEAIKVIDWVKENAKDAYLSIMSQYVPLARACEFPEINRRITKREYEKVLSYALDSGLENVYVQELISANETYIPIFDGKGVMSSDE